MSGSQLSILAYKDLRPHKVIEGLNVGMAEPRTNVGFICKTIEKEIMVRSPKGYFLTKKKKMKCQVWGPFLGRIGLPPAVTGWAASCGDGP